MRVGRVNDALYGWSNPCFFAHQSPDRSMSAKDFTHSKGTRYRKLTEKERSKNRTQSRIRSKVEHQFGILKMKRGRECLYFPAPAH